MQQLMDDSVRHVGFKENAEPMLLVQVPCRKCATVFVAHVETYIGVALHVDALAFKVEQAEPLASNGIGYKFIILKFAERGVLLSLW